MLYVTIPAAEFFDSQKEEFVYTKEQRLQLEHSLISIYKWESRWKRPFFEENKEKTEEETIDYIRCMTITQNVPDLVYYAIPDDILIQIKEYIDDPMTATTFPKELNQKNKEIATAEVLYYMMISLQIPQEWEKRHFNQLMTLLRVFGTKHEEAQAKAGTKNKPKKMSNKQMIDRNRLNDERRRQYNTRG